MAIVEMDKIRLLVHRSVAPKTLSALQRMGVIEFTKVDETEELTQGDKTVFEFNYASSRLDFAVDFLSRYEKKNVLRKVLEGTKVLASKKNIIETARSFKFNTIIETIQELEEELNDETMRIKNLEEEETLLTEWKSLSVPLDEARETKHTHIRYITGDQKEITSFENALQKQGILYDLERVSENNAALVYLKENTDEIDTVITNFKVEAVSLPTRAGTVHEALTAIENERNRTEDTIGKLTEKAIELTKYLPQLKMTSDYMLWKKEKHNVLSEALGTHDVVVFEGWTPRKKIPAIESHISQITSYFEMEKIKPQENEVPPTEIENNRYIRPFESITRLYGVPTHKDLDPTLFLAGFFFIFFGLCLTDVGYGIILFALIALVLTVYRVPKEMKPLLNLLMLGGLASIIIGLFFGGYFGVDTQLLPEWVRSLQYFDPIASPLPIFYLALALGFVQVVFGIVLKIVSDAKRDMLKDGLIDQLPWLSFFVALILFAANRLGFMGAETSIYGWLTIASIIAIVVTQGRKEKGIVKKGFMGILSLYNSIGYFSDVLSYSRLLALGLATSALAFSVNMIALLVNDMIPYVGFIFMIIVLIVGHLFNLTVNLLGAFIHSARLQFVEFFGKFIAGTGRDFKAFKEEERHVVID